MQIKVFQPLLMTSRFLRYGNRAPVYPTAANSYNPSHGQTTPNEQHFYKTTIPINEQHQHTNKSNGKGTLLTADQQYKELTAAADNGGSCCHCSGGSSCGTTLNTRNNDVTTNTQSGVSSPSLPSPTKTCQCIHKNNMINNNNTTTAIMAMRNIQAANTNHTTTTTTAIEYELSNGVAKLCKISTSRIAAEQPSTFSFSSDTLNTSKTTAAAEELGEQENQRALKLPLLTSSDLKDLTRNVSAINVFNQNLRQTFSQSPHINYQQHSNFSMAHANNNGPRDRLSFGGTNNDNEVAGSVSGLDRLQKKKYNKGLAFTHQERQLLGIHGLLPARVKSELEQVEHCILLLGRLEKDLDRYIYLNNLAERNERLFYRVLGIDISKMMPLVYTPTVGLACQEFSLIYENPKGMYITIKDKGHVYSVLKNWPETDVRAIVVTDGERILGLGDLGANGMGIPVGKLSLYTALAGIKPHHCLPVTLDVGTNTESILRDPLYIGLRQRRITGEQYDEFLDEFMQAVVRRFGQNCLIQFEDFANANAFRLLEKYRNNYCTFNDDIQGTAAVAVAGLLASLKIKNTELKENKILFFGAGEAALGIANLCLLALRKEGLSEAEAKERIWMVDSRGLIVQNRPAGGLTEHKLQFAQDHEPIDTLAEAVKKLKPSVLIGAAAVGGAFTKEILQDMAEFNDMPIIFALSNPTSKAECTAEQAYTYTQGKCIFSSGSPFAPVKYEGKTFYPGQGNNSYIFPGVALGVICAGMLTIPEEVFLMSAERLADLCEPEDLAKGSLYPPLRKIPHCSVEIATHIMEYAFRNGLATLHPEPENKQEFIKSQMYDVSYPSPIPEVYPCCNIP